MHCNRKKLAELLGRDVKTIDKMVRQGMPAVRRPGNPPGSKVWEFDTLAVIQWLRGDTPGLDERRKAARTRILVAEAELRRLQYLEAVGILIKFEDVVMPGFEEALMNIKANLYNLPARAAQVVAYEPDEDKVRTMLEREVEIAFLPADNFMAQMEELGVRSRQAQESLARDPLLRELLEPLKTETQAAVSQSAGKK